MRIQHNIAALNSYRQLSGNNNALSKNLEKLSSGYKINRAGDDAAGLAISEKMRAQIKGLEAAQKNANDGISLVQTAEGAMQEVHDMLNRMTYLATQSANGTYDNDVDRANLQKEVTSLLDEIDRISESTNFNGINLLDGSMGLHDVTFGATEDVEEAVVNITAAGTVDADNDVKEGVLTEGKAAVKASTSFYMPSEIQATGNGTAAQKTEFTFTFGDLDGGSSTLKIEIESKDKASTSTMTLDEIVAALNDPTTATGTSTGGAKWTITYTAGAGTNKIVAADFADHYKFSASGNTLTVEGLKDGKEYTVNAADLTITTGNADDKTAMEEHLKNQNPAGDYAMGSIVGEPIAAADKVDGNYKLGETKLKLTDTGATLHGTAVEVDGVKYVLKDINTEWTTEEAETFKDFTVVDFDKTKTTKGDNNHAADALAEAINAGKGANAGKFHATATASGEITIKEKAELGNAILADPENEKSLNMAGLVNTTVKATKAADEGNHTITLGDNLEENTQITIGDTTYEFVGADGVQRNTNAVKLEWKKGDAAANAQALYDEVKKEFTDATLDDTTIDLGVDKSTDTVLTGEGAGRALQVGDTSDEFQKVYVKVNCMDSKSLGIADIDISTQEGASEAIAKIKAAINTVSSTRGDLGAVQNRLEHTINNLGVTTENITAAESRIRDTDMAEEMMAYTKNNILVQAAQAMLAQANQVPQGVLQLLQ